MKPLNPHSPICWDFNKDAPLTALWGEFEIFIHARAQSACGSALLDLEDISPVDVYHMDGAKRWTFRVTVRPQKPNPGAADLEVVRSYIERWTARFPVTIRVDILSQAH